MNRIVICSIVLAMAGCGVEVLTTTAIQGELAAEQAKAMDRQLDWASDTSARTRIQHAVNLYQAEHGRYPASLDDLVPDYLPSLPARPDGMPYGYDPRTGKLTDAAGEPQTASPTAGDMQRLNEIRAAIDAYGRGTGYFPTSLYDLVPHYLAQLPKTASGQDFVYDPKTGAVYHPDALNRQSRMPQPYGQRRQQQGGRGVGGGGPMGEVMTGIGIQQELNSMSNAGASSAGGYARQKLGTGTRQHTQQQQQVMDELGF